MRRKFNGAKPSTEFAGPRTIYGVRAVEERSYAVEVEP